MLKAEENYFRNFFGNRIRQRILFLLVFLAGFYKTEIILPQICLNKIPLFDCYLGLDTGTEAKSLIWEILS